MDEYWQKLQADILDHDLETQCGTCVGVSEGTLRYEERGGILKVVRTDNPNPVPRAAYEGCPARFCNYPKLNEFVFHTQPQNQLSGVVKQAYVGHASNEGVRRSGASGGIMSATLLYLLETKKITGAVCLRLGKNVPYKAEPILARTPEDVLACAQSVYSVSPVNTILEKLEHEEGPLAYVGLPDQVAGIRKLQMIGHPSVKHIQYVLGPYMGTQMTFEAIRSFLRSHKIHSEEEILDLKYRAGEWPGYLQITLKNGQVLRAEKFYYNYLIPFFITQSSLQLVDFTNELTDISVGDAWSPTFEDMRGGFSVVLARSPKAVDLLKAMQAQGHLTLQNISLEEALDMHGHMLDFKKRGSFIRNGWRKVQPDYGYRPAHIPRSRIAIEHVLRLIFGTCRTKTARWIVEHLPLSIVGPCFNILRKSWKNMSKPTKRRGLSEMQFQVT